MQAIVTKSLGGPEVMTIAVIEDPSPQDGEVLIDVTAAGVNRADILQRQGHYPPPHGSSPILGLEVSGKIAALPADVEGWNIGDRVCALLPGGGYAERVAVNASQLLPVPNDMDLNSAAALPEALCTVYYNLSIKASLKRGETILIHGGGGGIGTTAIQIAKSLGARVACTAGSAEKLEKAAHLGADILINYNEQDFVEQMKREGNADVILDIIGASYLSRNIEALRPGGRIAIIGLQGGRKGELNLARLMAKQGELYGTTLRGLSLEKKSAIVSGVRAHYWPLVEKRKFSPFIDRTMLLSEASEAHRLIENGDVIGKILLGVGA